MSSENEFTEGNFSFSTVDSRFNEAIALVDCDSFYASCEQLANPALINQPVCVMSNNDGCIVARSKEAKALGVKMGMPVFQARKLFPEVYYISGNLNLYGDISDRVMSVLREFSPTVEIYSIDEAFLDFTGLRKLYKKSYFEIAQDIHREVRNRIGVPVSIGVSLTKTLAKLASEKAKKSDGVYEISYNEISDELKTTPVIDIWGVGVNTAALLNKFGIKTAFGIISKNNDFLTRLLGKRGIELKLELSGQSVSPVQNVISLPKSIQKTSSFATFTSDKTYIKNALNYHSHRACRKLRKYGMKTHTVGIILKTKDFRVYSSKTALAHSSNWEFEIFEAVNQIFNELYIPDIVYRSSGVILENLNASSNCQLSLFKPIEEELKHQNLAKVWDKLEEKYGNGVISIG